MDFEKIEQAYTYLLENVQIIQNDLTTNFYYALIEQNGIYLDGQTNLEDVKKLTPRIPIPDPNSSRLRSLAGHSCSIKKIIK